MVLIGYISLCLYQAYMYTYFKQIYALRSDRKRDLLLSIILTFVSVVPAYLYLDMQYIVLILIVLFYTIIRFIFTATRLQSIFSSLVYTFYLYASMGIVTSVISLTYRSNFKVLYENELYYAISLVLAVILSVITSLILKYIISSIAAIRVLLNQPRQLKFVVIYVALDLAFLMLINDGGFLIVNRRWFLIVNLFACLISELFLLFVIGNTIRVSTLLDYEIKSTVFKQQLDRQVDHYTSYKRFTESYTRFRHDYQTMMLSVKRFLMNQDYDRAIKLLDDINNEMEQVVDIHKTYSNNFMLDAMLQDSANRSKMLDVAFDAHLYYPETMGLRDLDKVRIFSNILDNAVKAAAESQKEERMVNVRSYTSDYWMIVEIENTFETLRVVDNQLRTTKMDDALHGYGLKIVQETLEQNGGFLDVEIDHDQKIFKTKVCIPNQKDFD